MARDGPLFTRGRSATASTKARFGRSNLLSARNGMTPLARTPVVPRGELVGPLSAEAVRKPGEFLQTIAQSEIFRDFLASKRSEGSKKRTE